MEENVLNVSRRTVATTQPLYQEEKNRRRARRDVSVHGIAHFPSFHSFRSTCLREGTFCYTLFVNLQHFAKLKSGTVDFYYWIHTHITQKIMLYNTILYWTLLLPLIHALQLPSHLSTETVLLCSTIYTTTSPTATSPLSTTTSPPPFSTTLDLSPVILHNYTTSTTTITPTPFSTLFSILATKTKTVQREAVDGVLEVEATKFKTSTFWHHVTVTATVTKERYLTSRTTSWIPAPSGFVGVRDGSLEKSEVEHIRGLPRREVEITSSSGETVLVKPTQGRFAGGVRCEQQVHIHTTQTLLLTASNTATITARPETVFKNRTVYGTVTSTILALPSSNGTGYTLLSSALGIPSGVLSGVPSGAPSGFGPPSTRIEESRGVITNTTTTVTKTPYTISFTHTATNTKTVTRTLHATTTITSYAACATANLLGQTRMTQRINGVSFPDDDGLEMESVDTKTPTQCCESCIRTQHCLWSIYEAEGGEEKGSCYLFFPSSSFSSNHKNENDDKKSGEKKEEKEKEVGVCSKQDYKARFGYSGVNGEVRYLVSNGLCGMLLEV
jgi:hypothetical protein